MDWVLTCTVSSLHCESLVSVCSNPECKETSAVMRDDRDGKAKATLQSLRYLPWEQISVQRMRFLPHQIPCHILLHLLVSSNVCTEWHILVSLNLTALEAKSKSGSEAISQKKNVTCSVSKHPPNTHLTHVCSWLTAQSYSHSKHSSFYCKLTVGGCV